MPDPIIPSPRIATFGLAICFSPQSNDLKRKRRRFIYVHRVSKRAPVSFYTDLHDVPIFQTNAVAETEAVRSKEVHMHIASVPMNRVLEVMVFNVFESVAHFRIAGPKALVP